MPTDRRAPCPVNCPCLCHDGFGGAHPNRDCRATEGRVIRSRHHRSRDDDYAVYWTLVTLRDRAFAFDVSHDASCRRLLDLVDAELAQLGRRLNVQPSEDR